MLGASEMLIKATSHFFGRKMRWRFFQCEAAPLFCCLRFCVASACQAAVFAGASSDSAVNLPVFLDSLKKSFRSLFSSESDEPGAHLFTCNHFTTLLAGDLND